MAEDKKDFEINIQTKKSGTGGAEAIRDLDAIKAKVAEVNATATATAKKSIYDVGQAAKTAAQTAGGAAGGTAGGGGLIGALLGGAAGPAGSFAGGLAGAYLGDWVAKMVEGIGKVKEKAEELRATFATLGRDDSAGTGGTAEERIKREKAALDELKKSIDEVTKAYQYQRRVKDELLDARAGADMAAIDAMVAGGMMSEEDARARKTGIRLDNEERKLRDQSAATIAPLNAAERAASQARQNAPKAAAALQAAEQDFQQKLAKAQGFSLFNQRMEAEGVTSFSDKAKAARAEAAITGNEGLATAFEDVNRADIVLGRRRRENSVAQQAVPRAEAEVSRLSAEVDPLLKILTLKIEAITSQKAGEELRKNQLETQRRIEGEQSNPTLYIPPSPTRYQRPRPTGPGRIMDETGDRSKEIEDAVNGLTAVVVAAINKAADQVKNARS